MNKKKIITLLLSVAIISQQAGVLAIAENITNDNIGIESINESSKDESKQEVEQEEKVGIMQLEAIDPIKNQAYPCWLTFEIADEVFGDKSRYKELTQEHFNTIEIIDGRHIGNSDIMMPQIGNLINLKEISLINGKSLNGFIPNEIGNLTNLTKLDLSKAGSINGNFPESMKNLKKLEYLDVSKGLGNKNLNKNYMSGDVVSVIKELTGLKYLDLSFNSFTGNILEEIDGLTNLQTLKIQGNDFYGTISDYIQKSVEFTEINISNNMFIGNIGKDSIINQGNARENLLTGVEAQKDLNFNDKNTLKLEKGSVITDTQIKNKISSLNNEALKSIYKVEIIPTQEGFLENVEDGYKALQNGDLDFKLNIIYKDNISYSDNNTYKLIIQDEVEIVGFEKLYKEISDYIKSSEYTNEGLAELLENNNELLNSSEYISKLDTHRKKVLGYRFRESFERDTNVTDFEWFINSSLNSAKVLTETSKFKAHGESESKGTEIVTKKNIGEIDITDKVFERENGQEIDADVDISNLRFTNPAISMKQSRIMLNTSNLESFQAAVLFDIVLNGASSGTNLNISIKVEGEEAKFKELYNQIETILAKENFEDELIELFTNNELLNSSEYISKLDAHRKKVLAYRFKESFNRNTNVTDFEKAIKNPLNFAKMITESSKLQGHFESNSKVVEVQIDKSLESMDITNLLKKLENKQIFDEGTTIEFKKVNHNALSIEGGKVLLDTNKFKSTFETYVDITVTSKYGITNTNIKLRVLPPATTEDEIKDQIENPNNNGTIEIVPEVVEDKKDINISNDIITSIIENELNLEVNAEDVNLAINSNLLKELNKDLGEENLKITTSNVDTSIVDNVNLNGAKAIGNINIDTNTNITNLGSKMTVKLKLTESANTKNTNTDVFVYFIDGKKTSLLQKSKIDSEGYVEFETSKLGNILITDKRIVEESKPVPPTPPSVNEAPTIIAEDVILNEGDKFDALQDVKAEDKEDGDITKLVKVTENTVDTSKAGIYKVIYEVTDSYGNKVSKEISVTVKKKIVEIITGWHKDLNNNWYYFDQNGVKTIGWQLVSGKWYYMSETGIMKTGWNIIKGDWFYLNESGAMQTGWKFISGEWYHMNESGVMNTGWKKINNDWYYLNENGVMQTGWKLISGEWYYMNNSGVMLTNIMIDGWQIGESGVATQI